MENSARNVKLGKAILSAVAALVILLAAFSFGIFIGLRKARFSYQWGENYHRLFGEPRPMTMWRGWKSGARNSQFLNAYSAAGSVIKVATSSLLIKGDDDVEKNIAISSSTVIRKGAELLSPSGIKTDDEIMALGSPSSSGQLQAKLIRIFNK